MARRPLLAGNWKMNGLKAAAGEFNRILAGVQELAGVDALICPPTTLIAEFAAAACGTRVAVGGQDCHALPCGPYTGDISAEMLKDAGAQAVIVGHSERRHLHGENDAAVRDKALAARRAGILAILCVGETQGERESGRAHAVVGTQLDGSVPDGADARSVVIAYEPVWAIGSGHTPTVREVTEMHAFIRNRLCGRFGAAGEGMRILYGGSVKPDNARELIALDDVDGALVGGASLKADEFLAIAGLYR